MNSGRLLLICDEGGMNKSALGLSQGMAEGVTHKGRECKRRYEQMEECFICPMLYVCPLSRELFIEVGVPALQGDRRCPEPSEEEQ